MNDIKVGYTDPEVIKERLSDGSIAYNVKYSGDFNIIFKCTDEQAAINLCSVINFGVVGVEVAE